MSETIIHIETQGWLLLRFFLVRKLDNTKRKFQ